MKRSMKLAVAVIFIGVSVVPACSQNKKGIAKGVRAALGKKPSITHSALNATIQRKIITQNTSFRFPQTSIIKDLSHVKVATLSPKGENLTKTKVIKSVNELEYCEDKQVRNFYWDNRFNPDNDTEYNVFLNFYGRNVFNPNSNEEVIQKLSYEIDGLKFSRGYAKLRSQQSYIKAYRDIENIKWLFEATDSLFFIKTSDGGIRVNPNINYTPQPYHSVTEYEEIWLKLAQLSGVAYNDEIELNQQKIDVLLDQIYRNPNLLLTEFPDSPGSEFYRWLSYFHGFSLLDIPFAQRKLWIRTSLELEAPSWHPGGITQYMGSIETTEKSFVIDNTSALSHTTQRTAEEINFLVENLDPNDPLRQTIEQTLQSKGYIAK